MKFNQQIFHLIIQFPKQLINFSVSELLHVMIDYLIKLIKGLRIEYSYKVIELKKILFNSIHTN